MTKEFQFSEQGYKNLIGALLKKGYRAVDFSEAKSEARHLILRHDVDISLSAAAHIALVEQELNVAAHYFVLVSSEFYNIFTKRATKSLDQILAAGHKVGLHFDAANHSVDNIDEAAAHELAALESVIGQRVEMISLHRPSSALVGSDRPIAGRAHCYQPKFIKRIGYCADSRGYWYHGDPLSHPSVNNRKALQLLTHPIWWIGDRTSPETRLDNFLRARGREIDGELAEQCSVHIPDRFSILTKEKP